MIKLHAAVAPLATVILAGCGSIAGGPTDTVRNPLKGNSMLSKIDIRDFGRINRALYDEEPTHTEDRAKETRFEALVEESFGRGSWRRE